jgi:hypothetical protein
VTHPFERWPATGRKRALIAVVIATIALEIALALLDSPLRDTGDGTVSFELAGSPERAQEIIDAWDAEGLVPNAAFIDGIDFLFAVLYATALAGLCVAAAGAWRRRGRTGLADVGIVVAWAAFAAAAFDWIEDIALGVSLLDEPASPWPEIALGASIPKFAGAGAALLFLLLSAYPLARRGPARSPDS